MQILTRMLSGVMMTVIKTSIKGRMTNVGYVYLACRKVSSTCFRYSMGEVKRFNRSASSIIWPLASVTGSSIAVPSFIIIDVVGIAVATVFAAVLTAVFAIVDIGSTTNCDMLIIVVYRA